MKFARSGLSSLLEMESIHEIPLFAAVLPAYVKRLWMWLGVAGKDGSPLRVAIFGAGLHTDWLYEIVKGLPGQPPKIVAILDDNPDVARTFWGLAPISALQFDASQADLILISSDTANAAIEKRCEELFGGRVQVLNPYKDFPTGPYFKLYDPYPAGSP